MERVSTRLGSAWGAGLALLTLLAFLTPLPGRSQDIIINEVLAGNTTIAPLLEYPDYFPDYVELYNASARAIDLGAEGWSITDDLKKPGKFAFTNSLIFPADSYLLVFCDSQDPTNFPGLLAANNLHSGFNLNAKGGETLAIFKSAGQELISSNSFGIQVAGYSVGRFPGANIASPFTLNYPTPCGGTIPCDTNTPYTNFGNQFTLKINEWLATNSMGDDWLEIFNPNTNIVELGGLVFTDDQIGKVSFIRAVPNLSYIAPQGYVRFWCDKLINKDADHLDFSLASGSDLQSPPAGGILDKIYLWASNRATVIDTVNSTLFKQRDVSEGRVPDGADRITYFPNPSPEDSNFAPIPELNINELLSHVDDPLEDAVELQNVSSSDLDISYWWFTNNKFNPKKYQIPAGTILPPGGFYVVYQYQWNSPSTPVERQFTFNSAHGDECYLFKADAAGTFLGFRKGVQFGPAPNGVSFGRHLTSDTNVEFVAMSDLSLGTDVRAGQDPSYTNLFRTGHGATNPYPLVGPIVINEVFYKPTNVLSGNVLVDDSFHEFVELRNITSANAALYYVLDAEHDNPDFATNGWKVGGVIKYDFDASTFPYLEPNEYALLVNFDPTNDLAVTETWRNHFTPSVPASTKLFGPYKGKLSNAGGSIELYRPDTPQTAPHPDAGFVPYVLVERVKYSDHSPWPTNSDSGIKIDGGGASLQRRYSYEFGNDPINWFGDVPTPGFYNSPSHIEILVQPRSAGLVNPGVNVEFTCLARDDSPVTYRWHHNGAFTGVTGTNLSLPNLTSIDNGNYTCVISNASGMTTSAVAVIELNCPFFLDHSLAGFPIAGGSSNIVVAGTNGCAWTVVNTSSWVTVTSGPNYNGSDIVTYTVGTNGLGPRSTILTVAGLPYFIGQTPADLTRPTVAVTAPAAGARVTIDSVLVRGTANDNVRLENIFGAVNIEVIESGASVQVTAARAWNATVPLAPGTNWIRVHSQDFAGNCSTTNTRAILYAVPTGLSLSKTGLGTVTGATNGQRLDIGRNYALTATPAAGFVFSNWTGTIPSSASPRLTFNMQTGLKITANFVPNPFIPTKGVYNGLFYPQTPGGVHHTNSGSFKLTLTDRGTYSSSIRVGGKTYAAAGTFDLDGKATNQVKRTGFAPLDLVWSMDLNGADTVTGSVNATDWLETAQLDGDRTRFNTRTNPAPYAGRYTLIIPGTPEDTAKPRGDGYGTATIDGNGLVKFAGTLGDGTKVSQAVSISKNGGWPLYAALYATRGSIISWVRFDTNAPDNDLSGLLSWVRPAIATSKIYPLGFEMDSPLTGSIYRAPIGAASRILQITDGLVTLSGGNLAPSVTNAVTLGLSSVVTNASPNAVAVKFTLASGLFTGTFTQAGTTRKISFSGAVHQKANHGSGFYPGTNETGRVTFELAPETP